jgi:hypothetical protein
MAGRGRATQDKEFNKMKFQKSADTKIIESILAECKVGQTITYEALSKAIGRDVRQFAMPSLRSARQGLLKSKGFVFAVETNIGLVRLDDSQIVESMESDRKKLQRAATRTINKLSVVDFDKLTQEKKKQHTVAAAQMGVIAMFSKKSTAAKIASSVNDTKTTLAIGETLSLFK